MPPIWAPVTLEGSRSLGEEELGRPPQGLRGCNESLGLVRRALIQAFPPASTSTEGAQPPR